MSPKSSFILLTQEELESMEVTDSERLNVIIILEARIVDPPQPNSKYFFVGNSSCIN